MEQALGLFKVAMPQIAPNDGELRRVFGSLGRMYGSAFQYSIYEKISSDFECFFDGPSD
jgi:hypothetical protein